MTLVFQYINAGVHNTLTTYPIYNSTVEQAMVSIQRIYQLWLPGRLGVSCFVVKWR